MAYNTLNINNVSLRLSAVSPRQFPADPMPQVAFSGRSNVGKSSLINTITGRRSLARVSSTPGKTITVNFYDIDKKLFLVDLPGYGYAKRSKAEKERWSELTDGYFTNNKNLDLVRLVVQLIDIVAGVTDDDALMLDYLGRSGIPYVIAASKADKPNKTERAASLAAIASHPSIKPGVPVIPFSSHTGEGKATLWNEILKTAGLP
jgi:GTP-binding protein